MQTCPLIHVRSVLTLMLAVGSLAAAQTVEGDLVGGLSSTTEASAPTGTPDPQSAALSRNYPITLNADALARAGATPGAGYVLLRDLKELLQISASGPRVTIKACKQTLVYTKGTRTASVNGRAARLNATPVNTQETSLFPLAAVRLLGCTYEPLEAMKTLRTYSVQCPGSDSPLQLQALTLDNKNAAPTALQFPR